MANNLTEILIEDESFDVQMEMVDQCKEMINSSDADVVGKGFDTLSRLRNVEDWRVKAKLVDVCYDGYRDHENLQVVRKKYASIMVSLSRDTDPYVRQEVASKGILLDKFINDPDPRVRAEVASKAYGLDTLINDPDPYVRQAIARHGYYVDQLINDPDVSVRMALAMGGYKLETLVDDPDYRVRIEVARKGYGLEKLAHDNYLLVSQEAEVQLRKMYR